MKLPRRLKGMCLMAKSSFSMEYILLAKRVPHFIKLRPPKPNALSKARPHPKITCVSFPFQVRALKPAENLPLLPRGQKLPAEAQGGEAASLFFHRSPLILPGQKDFGQSFLELLYTC